VRIVAAGVLFMIAAAAASATTPAAASSAAVPVPSGFLYMCRHHPAECRGGGVPIVHYSSGLMATITQVNLQVNKRIRPRKNEPIDIWSLNVTVGDCEDYVLAKRHDLIRKGVPASALSIVYALRNGGGHAILAVHTDAGTFALDNMTASIKPLTGTGYRLISMSGPNPMVWHRP
jgi:predicted transglutaminase-like cysteine proteinase